MTNENRSAIHRPREGLSLALLALLIAAEFSSAVSSGTIFNALTKLYAIYGDPALVGWVITSHALSSAATIVLIARLGDLYGRALMFKLMLVALVVGSIISAVATDLTVIIFGRVVQGLSMAILPLGFGLLREYARDSRELNFGVGMLGGTYSFSVGIGYIISGYLIDHFGWQHIFTFSAATAALALAWTMVFLPERSSRTSSGGVELVGALIAVPVLALLLTFNLARAYSWSDPRTLGLIAFGAVTLIAWAAYELRHPQPLVDLRLLANPTIAIVNASIFFMAMGPLIYPQVIMPLLQQPTWTGIGLGISAMMAGVLKLPTNFTAGMAAIGSGLLARQYSMRPAIIAATVANFVAFAALILFHGSLWFVLAVCILMIAPAVTVMFSCAPGLIIAAAPAERTSEVTGLTAVMRSLAQGIGTQLISVGLATSAVSNAQGTSFPDERAFVVTFAFIAATCLASMVAALFIPRARAATPAPAG